MKTDILDYYLPEELIAQKPAETRSGSRLLVFARSENVLKDDVFSNISQYFKPGDCLVLNDTKVLPARFFGRRKSGAKIEGLFLGQNSQGWEIMLKNARKVKAGEKLIIFDTQGRDFLAAQAEPSENERWLLKIEESAENVLEKIGFAPLPPYIKRQQSQKAINDFDRDRYQTVYAEKSGAVAAPTAGLHFTTELLENIRKNGVKTAYLTLHTGAGTFKPVSVENLEEHKIHSEFYSIDDKNARIINEARQNGGRIFAVGTTSVRTLETAGRPDGTVKAAFGETTLFILPGYKFKIVDAMITNFHLPQSTLLALVGAFAGLDQTLAAYKHAVDKQYRFYSYGDAMLIL